MPKTKVRPGWNSDSEFGSGLDNPETASESKDSVCDLGSGFAKPGIRSALRRTISSSILAASLHSKSLYVLEHSQLKSQCPQSKSQSSQSKSQTQSKSQCLQSKSQSSQPKSQNSQPKTQSKSQSSQPKLHCSRPKSRRFQSESLCSPSISTPVLPNETQLEPMLARLTLSLQSPHAPMASSREKQMQSHSHGKSTECHLKQRYSQSNSLITPYAPQTLPLSLDEPAHFYHSFLSLEDLNSNQLDYPSSKTPQDPQLNYFHYKSPQVRYSKSSHLLQFPDIHPTDRDEACHYQRRSTTDVTAATMKVIRRGASGLRPPSLTARCSPRTSRRQRILKSLSRTPSKWKSMPSLLSPGQRSWRGDVAWWRGMVK